MSLVFLTFSLPANATVFVHVPDVSLLKYQTDSNGYVWVRNLHDFDSSALGCCYNYYIDTNTQEGKNILALVVARSAQGKRLYIGVPNGFVAGVITMVGEF